MWRRNPGLRFSIVITTSTHVALGTNLNFLLPLADLLFGTLRRQLTPEELAQHGPLERAKARPIGHGERARAAVA